MRSIYATNEMRLFLGREEIKALNVAVTQLIVWGYAAKVLILTAALILKPTQEPAIDLCFLFVFEFISLFCIVFFLSLAKVQCVRSILFFE